MRDKCKKCQFFYYEGVPHIRDQGACTANPPSVLLDAHGLIVTKRPTVDVDDQACRFFADVAEQQEVVPEIPAVPQVVETLKVPKVPKAPKAPEVPKAPKKRGSK